MNHAILLPRPNILQITICSLLLCNQYLVQITALTIFVLNEFIKESIIRSLIGNANSETIVDIYIVNIYWQFWETSYTYLQSISPK